MIPHRSCWFRVAALVAEFTVLWLVLAPLAAQEPPLPEGAVARLGPAKFWHGALIQAVAFSPDETSIASFGTDNSIRVWETKTGRMRMRLDCPAPANDPTERVFVTPQGPTLLFSSDGTTLALADVGARVCRSWNLASGKELPAIPLNYAEEALNAPPTDMPAAGVSLYQRGITGAVALSHDGSLLAQAQLKDNAIHLLTPGKKEPVRKLVGQSGRLLTLAFTADGKMLASAGDDQSVRLWNLESGKVTHTLTGHRAAVQELAFAADGKRLVSASLDGTIRIWDVTAGRALARASWKTTDLQEAEVASSSTGLGTAVQLRRVWFDADGKRCGVFFTLAFGASIACEDFVARFDCASGEALGRQIVHDHRIALTRAGAAFASSRAGVLPMEAIAVAPGRQLLARTSAALRLDLIDFTTGHSTLSGLRSACTDVALAGDQVAIVQQGDSSVLLWNWKAGGPLRKLEGHTGTPFIVGFTPGAATLVTASRDAADRSLSLWDVRRGVELRQFPGWRPSGWSSLPVPQLSPDGQRIAFRDADGKLRVVAVATGADVANYSFTWKGNGCAAFSADSQRVVVSDAVASRRAPGFEGAAGGKGRAPGGKAGPGGAKGNPFGGVRLDSTRVCMLDVPTGKETLLGNSATYNFAVTSLVADDRHALVACTDGAIRQLDLATGKVRREILPIRTEAENGAGVITVPGPSSPDGRLLALRSSSAGGIWLLEVASGQIRHTLADPDSLRSSLNFAADSRHLVTGGQDSSVVVWALGATAAAPLTDADRAPLWQELGNGLAPEAFAALKKLMGDPAATVKFVGDHLHPVPVANETAVRQKIRDLDSASFTARQKAQDELTRLGDPIRIYLEQAAAERDASSEAKLRLAAILKRFDANSPSGELLRELRAVELLERLATPGAQDILHRLADGAPGALLTQEARDAVRRLAR